MLALSLTLEDDSSDAAWHQAQLISDLALSLDEVFGLLEYPCKLDEGGYRDGYHDCLMDVKQSIGEIVLNHQRRIAEGDQSLPEYTVMRLAKRLRETEGDPIEQARVALKFAKELT